MTLKQDRPGPVEIAEIADRLKRMIEEQERDVARIDEIRRTTQECNSRKILDTLHALLHRSSQDPND